MSEAPWSVAPRSSNRFLRWIAVLMFTAALLVVTGYVVIQIYGGHPPAFGLNKPRIEVYFAVFYGLLFSIGLRPPSYLAARTRKGTIAWWALIILMPIIGILYEADVFGTRRGVSLANLSVFALFAAMIVWSGKVFRLIDKRKNAPETMPPDVTARVRELSQQILGNPDDASAYMKRGHAYRDVKQFDLAAADFKEARRLETPPQTLRDEYVVREPTEEDEKRLADLGHKIDLEHVADRLSFLLFERANLNASLGRFPEALADAGRSIQVRPDSGSSYAVRSLIYKAMGNREAAQRDVDEMIRLSMGSR